MLKIEAEQVLGIHLYDDLSVFIAAVGKNLRGPGVGASIQPAQGLEHSRVGDGLIST